MDTIGEKIKKARKASNLTQAELAKKLGVSQQMVAAYENGKRVPKIETIKNIASALKVNSLDFIYDENNTSSINNKDYSKTEMSLFCDYLESIGYSARFVDDEDLFLLKKDNKTICTFDTGDFFDLEKRIADNINYLIELKSMPIMDYISILHADE